MIERQPVSFALVVITSVLAVELLSASPILHRKTSGGLSADISNELSLVGQNNFPSVFCRLCLGLCCYPDWSDEGTVSDDSKPIVVEQETWYQDDDGNQRVYVREKTVSPFRRPLVHTFEEKIKRGLESAPDKLDKRKLALMGCRVCPLDECDGSGYIVEEEEKGWQRAKLRRCRCSPAKKAEQPEKVEQRAALKKVFG